MNFEFYKNILKEKLSDKRYYHTECVANKAVELAKIYNVNSDKAYLAGLLHDITKQQDIETQLKMIKDFDIIYNNVEKESYKLYHSISGYIYVKTILKIEDEDILNAIKYHTTGRKDMSVLEKIVFVADSISEDRKYKEVEKLRELAIINLDLCLLELLKMLINKLFNNNSKINIDTFECYNHLCKILEG